MQHITQRQQQILDFIIDHQRQYGATPSRSEIARALQLSSASTIEGHLRRLAAKGLLELLPGRNRNIRLLLSDNPNLPKGLPIVGRVAAGSPILAVENIETTINTDMLFQPQAHFLLRVQGDSMMNAGIDDGDLLAVHKTNTVQEGQIIVARLDDDVTVKRLRRQGRSVRLIAANPAYAPITVDTARQDFAIEGLAVGVIRSLH